MGAGTGIGTTYTTYRERDAAPSTPSAYYDRLYFTSAGLYYVNSAGTAVPVSGGYSWGYAADAGSTDAYAVTLSPAPAAYAAGMLVHFKANTANTGNATLNVNSLGAKNILKNHDQTLADGDIEAGQIVTVIYDGTQWQMQSPVSSGTSGSDGIAGSYWKILADETVIVHERTQYKVFTHLELLGTIEINPDAELVVFTTNF